MLVPQPAIPFLWLNQKFLDLKPRNGLGCLFEAAFDEPFDAARHYTGTYTAAQFAIARSTILARPARSYRRMLGMMGYRGAPCQQALSLKCGAFNAGFEKRHDGDGIFEEIWAFVFPSARLTDGEGSAR